MKQIFIFFLAILGAFGAQSQTCERDSSVLVDSVFVAPAPTNASNPEISTKPACINEPYFQSVTLNIKESFTLNGFTAPLDSVTINTTGAISGLPVGLSYSCDPPNCRFKKLTLGCILIKGTPTAANTPGNFELSIAVKAFSPFLPTAIDLTFPGTISPGDKFIIAVKNPGECAVSSKDLAGKIAYVKNAPNPFGNTTEIIMESLTNDDFQFEVFDLLGKKVYETKVHLSEGGNQFTFDAGDLANGSYFYSIGNKDGKITKMMTVNK